MSDYKSREAIIAEIQRTMDMQDLYLPVHFIELLNDVPAADVKPVVRGEWLHREDFDHIDEHKVIHWHGMCSRCGFIHDFLDCHTAQYNYCPNCGADMRESKE